MILNSPITLFEYDRLPYSDPPISPYSNHLYLIDKPNQSNGELLTLHRNRLQAKQYVGLIQVMDLLIGILPKMYADGLTWV